VVSNQTNPVSHPVYAIDEDLDCFILTVNEEYEESLTFIDPLASHIEEVDGIWKMYFDGVYSKEGEGAGAILISPKKN